MQDEYLVCTMKTFSAKGSTLERPDSGESFLFWLLQQFPGSPEEELDHLQPIGNREFYSVLTLLAAGLVTIALTIGPLAIR